MPGLYATHGYYCECVSSLRFLTAGRMYLVGVEVIAPETSHPTEGLLTRHPVRSRRAQVGVRIATLRLPYRANHKAGNEIKSITNSWGNAPP